MKKQHDVLIEAGADFARAQNWPYPVPDFNRRIEDIKLLRDRLWQLAGKMSTPSCYVPELVDYPHATGGDLPTFPVHFRDIHATALRVDKRKMLVDSEFLSGCEIIARGAILRLYRHPLSTDASLSLLVPHQSWINTRTCTEFDLVTYGEVTSIFPSDFVEKYPGSPAWQWGGEHDNIQSLILAMVICSDARARTNSYSGGMADVSVADRVNRLIPEVLLPNCREHRISETQIRETRLLDDFASRLEKIRNVNRDGYTPSVSP